MPQLGDRLKNAWDAFRDKLPIASQNGIYVSSSGYRPDRPRLTMGTSRSVKSIIFNRIAVDCAQIDIKHVRLDEEENFSEVINDSLNRVLTKSANVDQTGRALILDAVLSMLDEGCVAIVPVVADTNPYNSEAYKIWELRTGKITEWLPDKVRVNIYNERIGRKEDVLVKKSLAAIVQNPFYEIMNEPNSTLQRLARVMGQVDKTNDQASAGKLDMIIQMPYTIKSDARIKQAEARRKNIEAQMTQGQYGIAWIDATEKVVQLNRSLENNLWTQAKELSEELYNQMGLTANIINGTANEQEMLNYNNRTIEPILSALTEEMERKWISKTGITQGQAIRFFRNPFKLVPVEQLAKIADTFTRNEIMTSNEVRAIIGLRPAKDPKADQLVNSNLNQSNNESVTNPETTGTNEISKSKDIPVE